MRRRSAALLCAAGLVLPMALSAQTVGECDGFAANARNIVMPPEVAIQSFANGDVRAIGLDTNEPACCSAHLMVTFFTADEPFPYCALISASEGMGFSGMAMAQLTAGYDPAVGLTLRVPAGRYDGSASVMSPLEVVINRATATVTARHY